MSQSTAVLALWRSLQIGPWEDALKRYWTLVKPENLRVEQRMDSLDREWLRTLNAQQWYEFLRDEYFRWKYTAPNRYSTTTRSLRRYLEEDRLNVLHQIKERLLALDGVDIQDALELAEGISGLGTAGASGLLALIYPESFGTVDQFVVKALKTIDDLPEMAAIEKMKPDNLKTKDGVVLNRIMRRKAVENNRLFGGTNWTPRKIDMVLWTCGDSGKRYKR